MSEPVMMQWIKKSISSSNNNKNDYYEDAHFNRKNIKGQGLFIRYFSQK